MIFKLTNSFLLLNSLSFYHDLSLVFEIILFILFLFGETVEKMLLFLFFLIFLGFYFFQIILFFFRDLVFVYFFLLICIIFYQNCSIFIAFYVNHLVLIRFSFADNIPICLWSDFCFMLIFSLFFQRDFPFLNRYLNFICSRIFPVFCHFFFHFLSLQSITEFRGIWWFVPHALDFFSFIELFFC